MNDEKTPFDIQIDFEQWRSDIDTFASTTKQVLESITSQLSNSCSNEPTSLVETNFRFENEANLSNDGMEINPPIEAATDRWPDIQTQPSPEPTEDRLAKLKLQLSQRMSKNPAPSDEISPSLPKEQKEV